MLVNFFCCFIPNKSLRKRIKRKLVGTPSRRRRLLRYGCKIENEIAALPEGVKIDISNVPHEAMGITKEVFIQKCYDLKFNFDAVLIDIGFNRGIASLYFATCPNIKKIYSFEPFRPTYELAEKNMKLNPHLSQKISSFNYGLGREDASLELPYMHTATGGMSTTNYVAKGKKNVTKETVIINDAAKEIDSIITNHKNEHIIIKCDCEGAEFEIFERLNEEGLLGSIDVVMIEYHFEKPDRLLNILTENGFVAQTKTLSIKSGTGYIYSVRTAPK